MTTPADTLLDAAVARVSASGIIESQTRMATVAGASTDGTISVTTPEGTIPAVRLVTALAVAVGDTVEITRSAGGWVCIGRVQMATPSGTVVDLRSGRATFSMPVGESVSNYALSIPALRGSAFEATVTLLSSSGGFTACTATNISATGMTIHVRRTTTTGVSNPSVSWIMTGRTT